MLAKPFEAEARLNLKNSKKNTTLCHYKEQLVDAV
jgi:hypothetical protein